MIEKKNLILINLLLFLILISFITFHSIGWTQIPDPLSITSVVPDSYINTSPVEVDINGSGFLQNLEVYLFGGGPYKAGECSTGGFAEDIAIIGSYAYVVNGEGLLSIDISDPVNPVIIGSVNTPGHAYKVVINGNYAYVIDKESALHVIDISDPNLPALKGECSILGITTDLTISENNAWIAYIILGSESSHGLQIIDIQNPLKPIEKGIYKTNYFVQGIAIRNNYAYITGAGGIRVLDITDPANPEEIENKNSQNMDPNQILMEFFDRGIMIKGRYAYVIGGLEKGLGVIDIADPIHPKLIGHCNIFMGSKEEIMIYGDYAYVTSSLEGFLWIINIADPFHPICIGGYNLRNLQDRTFEDPFDGPFRLAVNNNHAFITTGPHGMMAIDIRNPANPAFISAYETSGLTRGVAVSSNYAFVANSRGLEVIDISDPLHPNLAGSCTTPRFACDVVIRGDYAYLIDMRNFHVIDISDPTNPKRLGNYETSDWTSGITVSGNYAYVTLDDRLEVIDISDPNFPDRIGGYNPSYSVWINGVAVKGDYAYVIEGSKGLKIIDITIPANPTGVKSYNDTGWTHAIAINGNYAYVTNSNGFQVLDISDPDNPIYAGSYEKFCPREKITISQNYVYLTGLSGLHIVDISDPTNPWHTGTYNSPGFANGIAVSGSYAYLIADKELLVLDALPTHCTPVTYINSNTLKTTIPSLLNPGVYNVIIKDPNAAIGILHNGFRSICIDCDNDGFTEAEGDCDDNNAIIYPGAPELCDGKDNNCDQNIPVYELDNDQDGFRICEEDCSDEDPTIYPGAPELCDGKDNNCDQNIPVTELDNDEDGYFVCGGDCNDQDAQINPGKEEILCNSLDDDCDPNTLDCPLQIISIVPDSYINSSLIEATIHGSGFTSGSEVYLYLELNPISLSTTYIDPFTLHATIPAFIPIGSYDVMVKNPDDSSETLANGFQSFCLDCDNDGYSDYEGDCDDSDPTIFPNAPELCDGIDNNCDLIIPENELDVDQDGLRGCEGDCDDQDATIYPQAPELCDGIDNDCDQNVPLTELDADQDEYRICEGDCDDQDAEIHPGKEEILYNEKDDDCNPSTIDWPVKITSVTPDSYINSSPVDVTIQGSGFTPDSEVQLSSGGAFEVGILDNLENVYYVTINGDYAYIAAQENGLQVIDISDPTNPNVIGSYNIQPVSVEDITTIEIIQDIFIKNNYAYVANQHNGLLILDISNPSHPIYAGVYDTPGVATGVTLSGNYAYVADGNKGLQVLDITDPAHPEFAGSFESLSTFTYSVSAKDKYAYVLSQGLEIFDISDPTQPIHIGSLILGGTHTEIIVRDDYVYVSGEGLISIDVSDPSNPRIVGNYRSWASPYIPPDSYTDSSQAFWGLDISGNYAYITGNSLQMIDITDPTNLRWVGSYNTSGEMYSIDVNENYAYIADWENGLRIIDILGLADPSLAGTYEIWGHVIGSGYPDNGPYYVSYPTTNTSYDLTISGNYAYAIYSSCYQISPPSQIFDSYTMVKSFYQELRVIDITDPVNPEVLGRYESTMEEIEYSSSPYPSVYNWIKTGSSALVVHEGHAYITNGINLQVIDLRDPNHPSLTGNYDIPDKGVSDILNSATGSGIAISGNYAYMVNEQGLQIINITDPNHPILTGSYAIQGNLILHSPLPGEACGVVIDDIYAYISDGRGFHVIDISDPANPRLVSTKQEILCNNSLDNVLRDGLPCKLAIDGNYVYFANWDRGIDVIDISDPNSPVCIGGYDTPGLACRITINNTYAYVADGEAGLQVIDIANPENPALIRGYNTPIYTCGIVINNDYAYLADLSTLLVVIKINPLTPAFANYTCTAVSFIDFSTLSVTIPALLPAGVYNVIVKNPDGMSGTLPNGFYSICADCDNDGYTEADGDCDNHNATIYPGAPELCDGKDNDCDQIIPVNELDEDQDGYRVCKGDCDDQDITIYPGAFELCDGKDNDCDQNIPVTELDIDQDGYRTCEGDCDDQDGLINPSAAEIPCNGKDDDCNPNTLDCPLSIISVVPDSYINSSPIKATIHGSGFTPESEVYLCKNSAMVINDPNIIKLPRTGQTTSYYTGDDGDLQVGILWPEPRFMDHGNGTVTDKLTGLMWYKDASVTGPYSWGGALQYCGNSTLAGHTDWRLPNALEMFSLFCAENYDPPIPLDHLFIEFKTGFSANGPRGYWVSNSYYRNNSWYGFKNYLKSTDFAWDDDPKGGWTGREYFFIPVRGEPGNGLYDVPKTGKVYSYAAGDDGDLEKGAAWPDPRFTDNGDGTVTDNMTNLMWIKDACLAGEKKSWEESLDYCNNLEYADYTDWHLPNVFELLSVMDFEYYEPDRTALPPGHPFVNTAHSNYWTSTSRDSSRAYAFVDSIWINLTYGRMPKLRIDNKSEDRNIWPVRLNSGKNIYSDQCYSMTMASYCFSEGEGTKTTDMSWNGNDGTIYGATWTNGKFGNGLFFDGYDDYVNIPNFPKMTTNQVSVEAWVNFHDNQRYACIVDKGRNEMENFHMFCGEWNTRVNFEISFTNGTRHGSGGSPSISIGEWHHYVGTWDGSYINIYMDGNLVNTSPNFSGLMMKDTTHSLTIGKRNWPNPPNYEHFEGKIDEVHIYNRALSAEEVINRYNSTSIPYISECCASTSVSFTDFSTLNITIPALLTPGSYDVIIKNPNDTIEMLPNGFQSFCLDCDNDGYMEAEGDCDDNNAAIYPGAPELCDGKDNDCDQIIPANESDKDQDGYRVCEGDCDDQDVTIYPGALELCDGKDNNCDQNIPVFEMDADQDGYRVCEEDCDDQDVTIYPGAPELCDGKDNDCDGFVDEEDCEGVCLFTARITALKQVLNGFWDTSTVYIGLDTNTVIYPNPGPVPDYTVYMTISEDLLYDYRQTGSDYEEWHLIVRVLNSNDPNREEFFPFLNWGPNELCPPGKDTGCLRLYSEDDQGKRTLLVEDMYQSERYLTKEEDGQYVFALDMYVFSYYIVWSKEVPIEMNMSTGWNMISLPVIPYDAKVSDLFPEAVVVYGYEKGYGYVRVKEDENMEVGDGYWILFHEDQNYTLTGQPIQSYKKTLYEDGWKMIGGCTFPAQPSTDFCNIDVIYRYVPGIGYERVLESEYIDPGRGYWILYNNIVNQCELKLETIGYSSRIRSFSGSQDISEDIKIRFKKDLQDITWKMPITATGQVVNNAENVSTVYIGIDTDAVTYPSPGPIPDHTLNMELSGGLLEDYRQSGSEKEVWNLIILIENKADSNLDSFFPRLSWDASEIMPVASMELHLGDEYGEVIVDNMKTTSTYQTREDDASTYLPTSNLAVFSYTIVYEPLDHTLNHKDVNVGSNKDKKGKNDEFSNWMWIWPQTGYLIQDCWQQSPWINQGIWPLWNLWGKASNLTPEFVWSPLYYQNILYQQLFQNEAGYQLDSFDL